MLPPRAGIIGLTRSLAKELGPAHCHQLRLPRSHQDRTYAEESGHRHARARADPGHRAPPHGRSARRGRTRGLPRHRGTLLRHRPGHHHRRLSMEPVRARGTARGRSRKGRRRACPAATEPQTGRHRNDAHSPSIPPLPHRRRRGDRIRRRNDNRGGRRQVRIRQLIRLRHARPPCRLRCRAGRLRASTSMTG